MIKKEIANKLFKTELSEQQKIELAKIDELKSGLNALLTRGSKVKSDLSSVASSMQSGKKVADELISEAKKTKQMAEELGVESNEIAFVIKEAENYSSILDQLSKLIARNLGGL